MKKLENGNGSPGQVDSNYTRRLTWDPGLDELTAASRHDWSSKFHKVIDEDWPCTCGVRVCVCVCVSGGVSKIFSKSRVNPSIDDLSCPPY